MLTQRGRRSLAAATIKRDSNFSELRKKASKRIVASGRNGSCYLALSTRQVDAQKPPFIFGAFFLRKTNGIMKENKQPTGELYFLEYSRSQASYNIDSASRCIKSNLQQYANGTPSDWSVIAVGTRQECWETLQDVRAKREERIKVFNSKNVAV